MCGVWFREVESDVVRVVQVGCGGQTCNPLAGRELVDESADEPRPVFCGIPGDLHFCVSELWERISLGRFRTGVTRTLPTNSYVSTSS